jgi:ATP-dependent Clp protease ATP-binding subunit ClpA
MSESPVPDSSTMEIMLGATRGTMLRAVQHGLSIEAAAQSTTQSQDVLLYYLEKHPEAANRLSEMGVSLEHLRSCIEAMDLPTEAGADGDSPAPVSGPVKQAMKAAMKEAAEQGLSRYSIERTIAPLLTMDCNARALLLDLGVDAEDLSWLTSSTKEAEPKAPWSETFMADIQRDTRQLMDAAWPQLMGEVETKFDHAPVTALKNKVYEENPDRYEKSLSLTAELAKGSVLEEDAFMACVGICLHAAENEARIRKAPQVTLEHLFYVLLQDGTNTAEFLDERGVDRDQLRRRLDAEMPRFREGPRWPDSTRALTMSVPEDSVCHYVTAGLSMDELMQMPFDEQKAHMQLVPRPDQTFSDLMWLENACAETETLTGQILAELSITREDVRAALKSRRALEDECNH